MQYFSLNVLYDWPHTFSSSKMMQESDQCPEGTCSMYVLTDRVMSQHLGSQSCTSQLGLYQGKDVQLQSASLFATTRNCLEYGLVNFRESTLT